MRTPSGVIIDTDHGPRLRFERQYPYPANEVWSALTTPERVARWLGELRPSGDTTRLVMGDGDGEYADLTIVACERPTRIEVGWEFPDEARTHVLVTLVPTGAGHTTVVLEHTFPVGHAPSGLAGYGCGWQHYVDSLGAYLAGDPLPEWADYYPGLLDGWRALVSSGG